MTNANTTILPRTTSKNHVPTWRKLLHRRGLSDLTIDHFKISPEGRGWKYPVDLQHDAIRWKAFNSRAIPKYRWLPEKPGDVRFYDVDGHLKDYIAEANGELVLCEGEPDVWACWEGGVKNATCIL